MLLVLFVSYGGRWHHPLNVHRRRAVKALPSICVDHVFEVHGQERGRVSRVHMSHRSCMSVCSKPSPPSPGFCSVTR